MISFPGRWVLGTRTAVVYTTGHRGTRRTRRSSLYNFIFIICMKYKSCIVSNCNLTSQCSLLLFFKIRWINDVIKTLIWWNRWELKTSFVLFWRIRYLSVFRIRRKLAACNRIRIRKKVLIRILEFQFHKKNIYTI